MSDVVQNFKVIIALKSQQDLKVGTIRCAIQIHDKVKFTILPQSEGQFFDINDLSTSKPITIMFDAQSSSIPIGHLKITVPETIYLQKEVELADTFSLEYKNELNESERFNGRYYIIILNKGEILIEKEQLSDTIQERAHLAMEQSHHKRQSESPTKQFIKSTGERTQERTRKDNTKKLLAETKYDPKPDLKQSGRKTSLNKNTITSAKKGKEQQTPQQLSKYNSQKSLQQQYQSDQSKKDQPNTPNHRHQTEIVVEVEDSQHERMRSPPKRITAPFQKYHNQKVDNQQELEDKLHYNRGIIKQQQADLNLLEGNATIDQQLINDLTVSEDKRQALQHLIKEGIEDGIKFRELTEKQFNELTQENQKLNKKLKQQADKILEQDKLIQEKTQSNQDKDNKILDVEKKLKGTEELKRICGVQQDKLEEQDDKMKEISKKFQDQIKNLISTTNKLEDQHNQLLADKTQCDQDNLELLAQIQSEEEVNADLASQIEQLQSEIELNNAWELSAKTLRQQNDDLTNQVKNGRIAVEQLQQVIEQLRDDLSRLQKQMDERVKQLIDDIQRLRGDIKGQESRYSDIKADEGALKKQILLLKEQNISLDLASQLSQELVKQLAAFKKSNAQLVDDNLSLTLLVEELTESLQATNNQILELRADQLHQNQQQEESDNHNNNLKRLILEMKERGVAYIPMSNDWIDQKLAVFINSRQDSDRQRQLFVREGEGVYQFGSKKIYVKVEQDKILIRQGGGFISIEEFLNLNTLRESENMMRADPLAALQRNKAASRKIDEMRIANTLTNERMSPLRRKGTSNLD